MLGLDGQELWRWAAGSIPLPGFDTYGGEYYWDSVYAVGGYLRYTLSWNEDGTGNYLYVDLGDGTVYEEPPAGYPQDREYVEGVGYFDGGWYEQADGILTIHFDGGQTHTFPMPDGCTYPDINGDRVLFHPNNYDGSVQSRSIVTDLDGNVLFTSEQNSLYFIWQQWGDAPSLIYYSDFQDDGSGASWTASTVLDRDGNELFTTREYPQQFGDRLLYVSEDFYHLCDLEGSDLLRIPRWASLDLPADD